MQLLDEILNFAIQLAIEQKSNLVKKDFSLFFANN